MCVMLWLVRVQQFFFWTIDSRIGERDPLKPISHVESPTSYARMCRNTQTCIVAESMNIFIFCYWMLLLNCSLVWTLETRPSCWTVLRASRLYILWNGLCLSVCLLSVSVSKQVANPTGAFPTEWKNRCKTDQILNWVEYHEPWLPKVTY